MNGPPPPRARHQGLRRGALLCLGWGSFGLGAVGLFVPLLPTTPFMLIALWAFSSTSERLHAWLWHHRVFGPPLRRWERERVIPLWAKALSLGSMTASLLWMILVRRAPGGAVAAMLAVVAAGAAYVLRFPSRPRGS